MIYSHAGCSHTPQQAPYKASIAQIASVIRDSIDSTLSALLLDGLALAAVPDVVVEGPLPAVPVEDEVNSSAFVSMPAGVKARPPKVTVVCPEDTEVCVDACLAATSRLLFDPVAVKQNNAVFRDVVAQPEGQQALVTPLTEKVV